MVINMLNCPNGLLIKLPICVNVVITDVTFPQNAFDERNKELVKKTTFTSIIEDKDCEEECVWRKLLKGM